MGLGTHALYLSTSPLHEFEGTLQWSNISIHKCNPMHIVQSMRDHIVATTTTWCMIWIKDALEPLCTVCPFRNNQPCSNLFLPCKWLFVQTNNNYLYTSRSPYYMTIEILSFQVSDAYDFYLCIQFLDSRYRFYDLQSRVVVHQYIVGMSGLSCKLLTILSLHQKIGHLLTNPKK